MTTALRLFSVVAFGLAPICLLSSPAVAAAAKGGTSVWKVENRGGGATLYLAGSIHLLAEEDHPLPAAFGSAYESCERLVLEVKSVGGPEGDVAAFEKGMYGNSGGSIKDDLSAETYEKLTAFLADAGLPTGAMDGFRPWMAAMTLSLTEIMKLGCRPDLGVDSFFEGKALEDRKPVSGLETTEFQIGLFAKLDEKMQEQMLLSTIEDMAEIETEFPRLIKAWREGDEKTLRKVMVESMADMPEFRAEILDKRNLRWMKDLAEMLDGEEDVMVVVGAGHLVGRRGLVQMLRKRGYKVERLLSPVREKAEPVKPPRFIPVAA
jgi:uncharacterized protein YbaP (TraB family)